MKSSKQVAVLHSQTILHQNLQSANHLARISTLTKKEKLESQNALSFKCRAFKYYVPRIKKEKRKRVLCTMYNSFKMTYLSFWSQLYNLSAILVLNVPMVDI